MLPYFPAASCQHCPKLFARAGAPANDIILTLDLSTYSILHCTTFVLQDPIYERFDSEDEDYEQTNQSCVVSCRPNRLGSYSLYPWLGSWLSCICKQGQLLLQAHQQ